MPCKFVDGHMVQFRTNRTESLSNDIVVYVITHATGMTIKRNEQESEVRHTVIPGGSNM